jgi:glycosyltransferase involved in cell wall biosynthesis
MRIHHLNRGYAQAGWRVLQISGATMQRGALSLLDRKDVDVAPGYKEAIYFKPAVILGNRLMRAAGTAQTAASLLPRLICQSRRIATEVSRYGIILFEHPHLFDIAAPYLRDDHLVILDAHNIETHIFAHLLDAQGLAGAGARALREVERRCMHRADLIFACSDTDVEAAVQEFGVDPARVHLAPNGVDTQSIACVSEEERLRAKQRLGLAGITALFVGSRWPANLEAAHSVLAMASKKPEITFLIVGAVGAGLPANRPENVIVTGLVDDLQPWLAASDVALNPMESGSGSNIKIFEYCASGLPTISTPFGARGVEYKQSSGIKICEIAEFPEQISLLMRDPNLHRYRFEARKLVEKSYCWSEISKDILNKIQISLDQF